MWWTFLAAYVGVWLGFSVGAAALQVGLTNAGLLDHAGRTRNHVTAAVLLAGAGIYQFSTWKQRCQTHCVRPLTFFVRFWREGASGGARMGFRHGFSCVGCCWMLMLLAFVGGLADVRIMALATALLLIEKLPSIGRRISRVVGSALLIAAVAVLVVGASPDNGPTERDHPSQHTHATTSGRGSR
jgi:predicted metal-binding membrane protein